LTTRAPPGTLPSMCTLIVGIDRPRAGQLLLGANRDEALSRPTVSPHVLVREPLVVAGRDSVAGGTWLGVQPGLFKKIFFSGLLGLGCCLVLRSLL